MKVRWGDAEGSWNEGQRSAGHCSLFMCSVLVQWCVWAAVLQGCLMSSQDVEEISLLCIHSRCHAMCEFWTSQAYVYLLVEFEKYSILVYLFVICRAKIRNVRGRLKAVQLSCVCRLDWEFLLQAKIPLPVTFLTVSVKQCLKPCWSSFHNFQKDLFYWFNQYKKTSQSPLLQSNLFVFLLIHKEHIFFCALQAFFPR